ncbi:MAG: hypothetical protein NTW49_08800 [Bacteroidia bacterium]|nr:hypothetical protein [Bacteroidia bacterium]
MSFDKKYTNKLAYAKSGTSNVRSLPSQSSELVTAVSGNQAAGRTSGAYLAMDDGNWLQVNLYQTINGKSYGYMREDVVRLTDPPPDSPNDKVDDKEAGSLLENLVKNDNQTYHSMLKSAEMIDRLKKQGKDMSSHETKLNDLTARYSKRQQKLKDSTLIKWQDGLKKGYEWLADKWSRMVDSIGTPILIPIAIGAVVALGLAVTIYYAFKPDYEDSVVDLKVSADLEQALSKVSPEQAQKIKDDLNKQVDDAYNQGKVDQEFSFFGLPMKTLILGGLGIFAAGKILSLAKNRNN